MIGIGASILGLIGGSGGAFLTKIVDDVFQIKKNKQEHQQKIEFSKVQLQQSKIDHKQEMELREWSLKETKEIKQIELEQSEMEYSFKETMDVRENDSKELTKDASFWDKVSKSVRPMFAYIFMGFFIITKIFLIYAFYNNGVWDTKTIKEIAKVIWDVDTQTVFFTVVGYYYTQRYFQNAQNYVSGKNKNNIQQGTKVRS